MSKVPFSPEELKPIAEVPNLFGGANIGIYNSPISNKENLLATLLKKDSTWVPNFYDIITFTPRCIPDNEARAFCFDGAPMPPQHEEGFSDMFGVEWVYVPIAGGSMPRAGKVMMEDVNDWESCIKFPSADDFDWEKQKELSAEYVKNPNGALMFTILNGYFERLISFMEFENAAMAMIDEDQEEAVCSFFTKLTDLYCDLIDRFTEHFPVVGMQLHDDWGSQRAPFFSLSTVREMIVPHMKRLTDYAHEKGLFVELHSCGQNELLVPAIIEAGFDMWTPQAMNDIEMLYTRYGKQITLGVGIPPVDADSTPEQITAAAQKFVDTYVHKEAPVFLGVYSDYNRSVLDEVYRLARIKLAE